jgi:hypothetical protein
MEAIIMGKRAKVTMPRKGSKAALEAAATNREKRVKGDIAGGEYQAMLDYMGHNDGYVDTCAADARFLRYIGVPLGKL